MRKKYIIISFIAVLVIILFLLVLVFQNRNQSVKVREKEEVLRLFNENANTFQFIADTLNKYDHSFSVSMQDKKVKFEPNVSEYTGDKEFEKNINLVLNGLKFNIIKRDKEKGYLMFGSNQGIIYSNINPSPYVAGEVVLIKANWYYFVCYLV